MAQPCAVQRIADDARVPCHAGGQRRGQPWWGIAGGQQDQVSVQVAALGGRHGEAIPCPVQAAGLSLHASEGTAGGGPHRVFLHAVREVIPKNAPPHKGIAVGVQRFRVFAQHTMALAPSAEIVGPERVDRVAPGRPIQAVVWIAGGVGQAWADPGRRLQDRYPKGLGAAPHQLYPGSHAGEASAHNQDMGQVFGGEMRMRHTFKPERGASGPCKKQQSSTRCRYGEALKTDMYVRESSV